jgi:lipid-binding SYLF domain-containing protein
MRRIRVLGIVLVLAALAALLNPADAGAATASELNRDGAKALKTLCAKNKAARLLNEKAVAVLVFPNIVKAGFMFGGQIGEGVLLKRGKPAGYYSTVAASYGFQAGVQSFGYALFFMNDEAMSYPDKSGGWEIGSGPSFVAVDSGMAKKYSSSTLTKDIYAFIFGQKGRMAGIGLEGSKISKVQ